MKQHHGMTLIVKTTARLVSGFIAVFGLYVALTGHLGPGGGFAGGVILAASGVLIVLAFGRRFSAKVITDQAVHVADAAGASLFLLVAVLGFLAGAFFANFIPTEPHQLHKLKSAGTIPISNLAIFVKVGAGLLGAFLALSAFRLAGKESET
ncbi:MAG: MnhB domain-containing protein [Planctomycetota bacterium]|jgi:multicomponent Na+:H+ antiporter subunit B